jgi:hypothetical protein
MNSIDLVVNLVMENDETLIKTYCDGTELWFGRRNACSCVTDLVRNALDK